MSAAPNATFAKFGWPATKIAELGHWGVMLRPDQPTLGAVILACKEPVTEFGAVSAAGFAEFARVVPAVESMLKSVTGYEKLNYLMLMMVDRDVHFHVLPRYAGAKALDGVEVEDAGWPGPPTLGAFTTPDAAQAAALIARLRAAWPL
ncbi:MAG: HIT family protein [Paracoccaceae bacterium]